MELAVDGLDFCDRAQSLDFYVIFIRTISFFLRRTYSIASYIYTQIILTRKLCYRLDNFGQPHSKQAHHWT